MNGTVLIVDDTPANLALVSDCLQMSGLTISVAQDAQDGIRCAELVRPDVILMDVVMPGMDGFAACRQLKAMPATRDIPVIFMTALTDVNDKVAGFTAGGVDFVSKPFDPAEVLARVNTHLTISAMRSALAAQNLQLNREVAERREAETKLRLLNQELEERVARRTAELQITNRELQMQVDARTRTEQRIRRLIEANIIGILFWDLDGAITDANDAFLDLVGYTRQDLLAGRLRWTEMTPPEYRAVDATAVKDLAATGNCRPFEKEYIRKDGQRVPVLLGVAAFDEGCKEGIAFVLDLTERRRAEQRQVTLLDELNHRVKNTLAIVQAIAAQTMYTAATPEEFWAAFEGRLLALSRTHDLLYQGKWEGASLADVLRSELLPHTDGDSPSFVLSGRDIRLGPVAAVTLGMAFHELATNAAKYGALSVPEGKIRVHWEVDARHRLYLEWEEVGGPPIQMPRRRGFGSRLIETVLARELSGEVHLDFPLEGVHCSMETSLDKVSTH